MKKLLLPVLLLLTIGARGQSLTHTSNFPAYQQYHNPSLTGFEGTAVKTFYRNQWTGFEGAPKTVFLSGELDAADLRRGSSSKKQYRFRGFRNGDRGAQHAFGLAVLQDYFGPAKDSRLFLSYGASIWLSDRLSMRWGTALTYSGYRLDGNALTVDQQDDPRYQKVLGQNNFISKVDLNLGLALTGENFYLGYALHDATKGEVITLGDDYIKDIYTHKHIAQAGYRTSITDQFGIVINGIYQHDTKLESTIEGQLKMVYQNMFWLGGGYRKDLAYNIGAGLNLRQFRISYAYEVPVQDARAINKSTNEIGLSYSFMPLLNTRNGRQPVSIW